MMGAENYHVMEPVGEDSSGVVYERRCKLGQGEVIEIFAGEQVQAICKQLMRELLDIYSNRIIHSEMKPDNFLIRAGSVLKVEMGTTIGVLMYDNGVAGFRDSRITFVGPSKEESRIPIISFIQSRPSQTCFYLSCGYRAENQKLAKYLVEAVEAKGDLVGIDVLARIAHKYLNEYRIAKPNNPFIIGGIIIGWLSNKRFQAFKVLLEEASLPDLEHLEHLDETIDLETQEYIKQQIVVGSGSVYAVAMLKQLAIHPQMTKDQARRASFVSTLYASMCSNQTGGKMHVYFFPHGEGFCFESGHEEVESSIVLHLRYPLVYPNHLLLARITSFLAGPLTEFEQQMSSREGVICTSMLGSKNGYNYYRVFCQSPEDANTIFRDMTQPVVPEVDPELKTQQLVPEVDPVWWFKRVPFLLGKRQIHVDVGKYSENLLREILAAISA